MALFVRHIQTMRNSLELGEKLSRLKLRHKIIQFVR